jgi:hypothetical protein
VLQQFMPRPETVCENENGEAVDARGIPLPPFIVMEKGLFPWMNGLAAASLMSLQQRR